MQKIAVLVSFFKYGLAPGMVLMVFLLSQNLNAQDQNIVDSLEFVFEKAGSTEKKNLRLLKLLSENHNEPAKKLKYSKQLYAAAKEKDCTSLMYSGLLQTGNAYLAKADYSEALDNYFKAGKIAKSPREYGIIKLTIGDVYSLSKNYERSANYYEEAIDFFKEMNDTLAFATAMFNAGDGYLKSNELDKATKLITEAESIFRAKDVKLSQAYCIGTLGLIYAKKGRITEAEENIKEAIQILEREEDYSPICEFLIGMSDIYSERNDDSTAVEFAVLSRDLARTYGFKNEVKDANFKLAQLYEKMGRIPESYNFFKEYIIYKDSILNVETAQEMSGLRADYEVAQKQAEVDLLNEQRKNQQLVVISTAVASFFILVLAFGLYRRNRFIKRTSAIIEKEKNRSELLLLNILPEETAKELKKNGKVRAKKFESVTVLFADFKRFTAIAERLPPERLIKTIDYYFSQFDKIMEKYNIEKIKTIGDSYMAASGLPFPAHDHAYRILMAAFEMTQFVKETKENSLYDDADFDVRIGLNSGPVVAGVVGTKKFAYDIWGDTVNIAARMESHSDIGRINISENTYELVKDQFECEYRGEVEVKNQRILKMYYVINAKEEFNKKAG